MSVPLAISMMKIYMNMEIMITWMIIEYRPNCPVRGDAQGSFPPYVLILLSALYSA